MRAPSSPSSSLARRSWAAWALAFAAAAATAEPVHPGPRQWGFVLPTLDGERFLRTADLAGPVLVNFWSIDCPPCVAELPRLQAFALANPNWTVLLAATDAPADARRFLQQRGIALPAVRAGPAAAGLMRQAGSRDRALPFTVTVRNQVVCGTYRGEIAQDELGRLHVRC